MQTLTKARIMTYLNDLFVLGDQLTDSLPEEDEIFMDFVDTLNSLDEAICFHLSPPPTADETVLAEVTHRFKLKEGPYIVLLQRLANRFIRLSKLLTIDAPQVILEGEFKLINDALRILAEKAGVEFPPHESGT